MQYSLLAQVLGARDRVGLERGKDPRPVSAREGLTCSLYTFAASMMLVRTAVTVRHPVPSTGRVVANALAASIPLTFCACDQQSPCLSKYALILVRTVGKGSPNPVSLDLWLGLETSRTLKSQYGSMLSLSWTQLQIRWHLAKCCTPPVSACSKL